MCVIPVNGEFRTTPMPQVIYLYMDAYICCIHQSTFVTSSVKRLAQTSIDTRIAVF